MRLGFSYVGLIFLLLLIIPNMIWARNKPKDYEKYAANENKLLAALERVGEVLVSATALIFSDFNLTAFSAWTSWLIIACALMLLYEVYWVRYFKSERTMKDFYTSLLGIPVAGATLPVAAFVFLSVYGRNPFLFVSAAILGVGHIGIHWNHKKEIQ